MHIGLISRSQIDYALDLAIQLDAEGVAIDLYLDYVQTVEEVGNSDKPVERLYESGLLPRTCSLKLLKLPRMRDLRSFSFLLELKKTIQRNGIELVHILLNPGELWLAVLARILTGVPVVTTVIVPVANLGERLPSFLIWLINKIAISGSDMIIVNGADQVELLEKLYKVSGNHISYVPLSLYTRAARWRTESIYEQPGTILFFGRAHPQKGLEYLVKAQPIISQRIPQARILISAHGEDLERCRQMIQDQSKFEIYEGVVPGDRMAEIFQKAAVVALPYLTASTSGVLVTAYSFAKPVVASSVGCLAEYVNDGETGFLVPSADVEKLADAIVKLLLDDKLRHRMGINAENWMREMQRSSIKQTLDVYSSAIAFFNNSQLDVQMRETL